MTPTALRGPVKRHLRRLITGILLVASCSGCTVGFMGVLLVRDAFAAPIEKWHAWQCTRSCHGQGFGAGVPHYSSFGFYQGCTCMTPTALRERGAPHA